MVKINNYRPPLRKKQGPKFNVQTIVIVLLGCIVGGYLFLLHSSQDAIQQPSFTNQQPAALLKGAGKSVAAAAQSTLPKDAPTIGYAVSVTGCGSDPLSEGAAVLKHSVHQASEAGGRYNYQMYAIVHPEGMSCGSQLGELGYKVLKRETPVAVKDIQGEFLRSRIEKNG